MDAMTECQRQLIQDGLRGLANTVTLLYYTPDVASVSTRAERALLEDIARASDRIQLNVLAERWDTTREHEVGIARTPAIVVRRETDYGIRYCSRRLRTGDVPGRHSRGLRGTFGSQ